MMTPVTFEGVAPFALPVLQSGGAVEQGGLVAMTLYVIVSDLDPAPIAVHVDMTAATADHLGTQLLMAAADALVARKRGQ